MTIARIICIFEAVVFFKTEYRMARRIEMQICLGSSCFSRGNKDVVMFIREYIRKNHLDDKVIFKGSRCMGRCSNGPNLSINGEIIEKVTVSKIEAIMEKEFAGII
jgi:NADH:ubiquinone oxidoreductase subunit E